MSRVVRNPKRARPASRASKPARKSPRRAAVAANKPAKRAAPPAPQRAGSLDDATRAHVVALLRGGQAHVTLDDALRGFPPELRGVVPDGAPHSAWQIVEHLRISLWDILEFSRNVKHVSPEFPTGYWPVSPNPPHPRAWDRAVESIRSDTLAMERLVDDSRNDLVAKVRHPDAQPKHTILREAMVAASHASYHLAELILLRRLLGTWPVS